MSEVSANRLLHLLAEIETALPAIAATPAVREVGSQVASGSAFASRPPADLSVLDLTWWASNQAVLPKLLSWAVMIAEDRNDQGLDDAGPTDGSLAAVCAYLRSRIGFVVTQTWAGELESEWSDIRAVLRRAPGSPLLPDVLERAACPAVIGDIAGGRPCLGMIETRLHRRGDRVVETISCPACGTVYSDAAMGALILDAVEADIVTGDQVLAQLDGEGLTVTATALWKWASRGSVARHGKVGRDQTYSLTEVRAYARHRRERVTLSGVGVLTRRND